MIRFIDLRNKIDLSLNVLSKITYALLSALVLFLIYREDFQSLKWYSVSAGLLLAALVFYEALKIKRKSESPTSLRERLEVAFFVTLGFEVLFEALGREFFPLFYLVTPILFAYLGWQGAALAVILISALEFTLHFERPEIFYRLVLLLVSTFGLGYLIKRNRAQRGYGKYLGGKKQAPTPGVIPEDSKTKADGLKQGDVKRLQKGIRESLETLGDILSSHSVVLYLRGEDGFFEIEDFISGSPQCIDGGQKIRLLGGYLGWITKTKTPILVNDVKNHKENLIYYTRDVPVKSFLAVPVVFEDEEDPENSKRESVGILIADSLEQNAFGEKEKLVASLASGKIAQILNMAELSQKIQLTSQELNSFYEFTKRLSSTLELDAVLDHIIGTVGKVLEADVLGVTLLDKETNTSVLKRIGRERREDIEGKAVSHQDTLIGLVAQSKNYLHFEDFSARKKHRTVLGKEIDFALMKDIKSILIYPLKEPEIYLGQEDENILGCLIMGRKTKNSFNEAERSLAKIMSQEAAKAISNSLTHLKIKELAIKDGLTGLYNHRHFQEMLSHVLARSDRFPEKVSLVLIDLDNLKQINDTYGHQAGDMVLASLGRTISESLRKIDISARYGGDEFVVVLPNTGKEGARVAVEKLRQKVERVSLKFKGEELKITLSIGIATYPENAKAKDSLIEKADRALYEAKKRGKNRIIHCEDFFVKELVSSGERE